MINQEEETLVCTYDGKSEVFHQKVSTSFSIHHIKNNHSECVFHGKFKTLNNLHNNRSHVRKRGLFYLQQYLSKLNHTPKIIHNTPRIRIRHQMAYFLRKVFKYIQYRLFPLNHPTWKLGYSRQSWESINLKAGIHLQPPANGFLADPFLISHEGQDYCFAEAFDYSKQKGSIVVFQIHEDTATRLGTALSETFHLSFPYVFRHGDAIYMIPESAQNNDIRLYQATGFPLKWSLHQILMSNVSAADTMVFEHDGRWWLFTNINPVFGADHASELFIFYADSPTSNEWTPHLNNPVIIDPEKARNGGIIIEKNRTIRVGQRQAFNQYGYGFSLYEIMKLTPDQYIEQEIKRIDPDQIHNASAIHHMHSTGPLTVFDFLHNET